MNGYDRQRSIALTVFVTAWVVVAAVMATTYILAHVERHWVPWTMTLVSILMVTGFVIALVGRTTAHAYTEPQRPRPRGGLYIPPQLPAPTYRVVDVPRAQLPPPHTMQIEVKPCDVTLSRPVRR